MSAAEFIDAIRGTELNSFFMALPEGDKNKEVISHNAPFAEVKEELDQVNGSGTHGIFMCINDVEGPRREAKNVTKVRALFIDIDDGRPLPAFAELKPSIIVQSSTAGKWHAYWLCSDCTVADFKAAQTQLITYFNSDKAAKDPSRIMRVPGFYHHKNEPVMCSMLQCNPELVYTVDQILKAHPAQVYKGSECGLRIVESDDDYQEFYDWCSNADLSEGGRHETAQKIALEGHG